MTDAPPPQRPSARPLTRLEQERPAALVPPAPNDAARERDVVAALARLADVLAQTSRSIDAIIEQLNAEDPEPRAPEQAPPAADERPSRPEPPAALAGHVWTHTGADRAD